MQDSVMILIHFLEHRGKSYGCAEREDVNGDFH
jgi:hypothetical protein